ncbi:hypothetical protein SLEP1_g11175 [Rubroshorea leprosula]|uniref:Retrovirus-related Pol polyprotein from transposon TNT 1-94-like beta-barrel domain-containing protein n=1 Tax=Rubroshorea leprosula TaxID=152421 RepID=A0AAV5IAI0_9ROSI|nr:hypothetical protein SLEP1_g11175 [Rubroshorea leprosula]
MQIEATKYSIELFDGKNDFALWQSTVKDVLTCQGLDAALEETKPAEVRNSEWSTIEKKAASQIRLALAPEVKYNVLLETTPIDVTSMLLENDKFFGEDDGANQTNALVMEHSRGRSNGRGGGGNRERSKSRPKKDYGEVQCFYCGELGKITVATSEKVNIEGIGDVYLNVHNGRAKILKNVRYVPKCSSNIIALSELTTRGCKYVGKQEWCKVYKGGRLVLRGRKNKHNIYVLEQHLCA